MGALRVQKGSIGKHHYLGHRILAALSQNEHGSSLPIKKKWATPSALKIGRSSPNLIENSLGAAEVAIVYVMIRVKWLSTWIISYGFILEYGYLSLFSY